MPYDASAVGAAAPPARVHAVRRDDEFHQGERLVVVAGASLLGALIGALIAIGFGRAAPWAMALAGAPVYALALYFTVCTFHDAAERRAWGCAAAATAHTGALFAWPVIALMHPQLTLMFWWAPAVAFSALALFASCWSGAKRVLYRACLQGMLTATCAAYLGVFAVLGG